MSLYQELKLESTISKSTIAIIHKDIAEYYLTRTSKYRVELRKESIDGKLIGNIEYQRRSKFNLARIELISKPYNFQIYDSYLKFNPITLNYDLVYTLKDELPKLKSWKIDAKLWSKNWLSLISSPLPDYNHSLNPLYANRVHTFISKKMMQKGLGTMVIETCCEAEFVLFLLSGAFLFSNLKEP